MRITLTRVLGSGFALATAAALVLPGVAAAEESNTDNTEQSSGSGSTSGSLKNLPIPDGVQDFVTAMQKIASGEIKLDTIGDCVTKEFAKEDLTANPIEVILGCIVAQDNKTDDTSKGKTDEKVAAEKEQSTS